MNQQLPGAFQSALKNLAAREVSRLGEERAARIAKLEARIEVERRASDAITETYRPQLEDLHRQREALQSQLAALSRQMTALETRRQGEQMSHRTTHGELRNELLSLQASLEADSALLVTTTSALRQ
jgi:chromosome segregation ATPase